MMSILFSNACSSRKKGIELTSENRDILILSSDSIMTLFQNRQYEKLYLLADDSIKRQYNKKTVMDFFERVINVHGQMDSFKNESSYIYEQREDKFPIYVRYKLYFEHEKLDCHMYTLYHPKDEIKLFTFFVEVTDGRMITDVDSMVHNLTNDYDWKQWNKLFNTHKQIDTDTVSELRKYRNYQFFKAHTGIYDGIFFSNVSYIIDSVGTFEYWAELKNDEWILPKGEFRRQSIESLEFEKQRLYQEHFGQ